MACCLLIHFRWPNSWNLSFLWNHGQIYIYINKPHSLLVSLTLFFCWGCFFRKAISPKSFSLGTYTNLMDRFLCKQLNLQSFWDFFGGGGFGVEVIYYLASILIWLGKSNRWIQPEPSYIKLISYLIFKFNSLRCHQHN